MSAHTWVLENLAAHAAGGLDAAERERLERHLAECPECSRAADAAQAADQHLLDLFATARPGATLEDRMIRSLRQTASRARPFRWTGGMRAVLAVAAAALLAVVGAGVAAVMEPLGELRTSNDGRTPSTFLGRLAQGPLAEAIHLDHYTLGEADEASAKQENNTNGVLLPEQQVKQLQLSPYMHLHTLTEGRKSVMRKEQAPPVGGRRPLDEKTLEDVGEGLKKGGEMEELGFIPHKQAMPKPPAFMIRPAAPQAPPPPPDGYGEKAVKEGAPAKPAAKAGLPGPTSHYFLPGGVFKDQNGRGDDKAAGAPLDDVVQAKRAKGKEIQDFAPQSLNEREKGTQKADPGQKKPPAAPPAEAPEPYGQKIIIRSGDIDFEVESFDDAVALIQKLVAATKGGFIATINSDKLANGKVKGSVVVRVPPGQLDGLVMGLRKELGKAGDLKGQRIGSQDITKQYTDLESRLRAARTMEKRLLKIIQEGKGEIKDLVAAEKELGVWNTKIEEIEGELKYYQNQVSLSTLTINLAEKEIRTAAAVKERERVQAGVEVEDVEKAMRDVLKAVEEARGRVTKSELKQVGARQFNAQMEFEIAPEKAGPVRDRLKQIGHVSRLEIDRTQTAEGGGPLPKDGKLERGETRFFVSLYNLANVQPRETVTLKLAAPDVAAAYRAVRKALEKAIDEGKARVTGADLNEQDRQNVTARLDFDIRWTEDAAVQAALAAAGETLSRQVARAPEGENVTDKKILYHVELVASATIEPRETITLAVEVSDVENSVIGITSQVKEAQGRVVKTDVAEDRSGRTTAHVIYDVPLSVAPAVVAKVKDLAVTKVRVHQTTRNLQAPEGKMALARIDVTLATPDVLVPRDEGLGAEIRYGLSLSLRGLLLSVRLVIIGLLFVLPWVVLIALVVWVARKLWRPAPAPVVVATPPAAAP